MSSDEDDMWDEAQELSFDEDPPEIVENLTPARKFLFLVNTSRDMTPYRDEIRGC